MPLYSFHMGSMSSLLLLILSLTFASMSPAGSTLVSDISGEFKDNLAKDFKNYFSRLCMPITAASDVSFHRPLFDSLQLVRESSSVDVQPLTPFLIQKWFDSHRVLVHLAASRIFPHLEAKKRAEVSTAAKELNVFLIQPFYWGMTLKNDYNHLCMELIVRAAPVNKFYKLFFETTFPDLNREQKQLILNTLLETFNPDECKFFSIIIVQEKDGIDFEFF